MEKTLLQARLTAAYNYFHQRKHLQNMQRIKELAQKLETGEYGIAFAGHFSAGKSRMINTILGENLLPSSPIPTSANLVRVHKGKPGEDYARVYFHQDKPRKYLAPYDYDLLRSFCRDGDAIREIELCRSDLSLPEQVIVMDTPGIDSADDAHRKSTEEALHLADIIFYVMDYNHVQAELNLSFTRDLTQAGKVVYLVVNQIDKHVATELSFDSFCQGVREAFLNWGVQPAGFYFTSLRYPDHPDNQFVQLQEMLQKQIAQRENTLLTSIEASLHKILQEYQQEQIRLRQENMAEAVAVLARLEPEREKQLRQDYFRLQQEQVNLQSNWEQELDEAVQKIMDNAYLMPTSTRDLARDYLEACQPDFKVGFFGRGKKTLAEMARRRQLFFEDASEKAKTQLAWHIKSYLVDFARKQHIDEADLLDFVEKMEILPPEELLTEAMRSGAKLTQDGTYVMNYTANFAEGTKAVARRFCYTYKEKAGALLEQRRKARGAEIAKQLQALADYGPAWEEIKQAELVAKEEALELRELEKVNKLPENWQEVFAAAPLEEEIVPPISKEEAVLHQGVSAGEVMADSGNQGKVDAGRQTEKTGTVESKEAQAVSEPVKAEHNMSGHEALNYWGNKLRQGSKLIQNIPMLKQLSEELAERAQRLDNKGFMVTLFGAFSAGKSSFANSLLGEGLLPVSPNPTTAAINKICPVDENHPHGTVVVKLKDEAMLLADVNRALGAFELQGSSIAEAEKQAGIALEDDSNDRQREKSFLRAFLKGLPKASSHLGQEIWCQLEDFGAYAAQEEKSCFVDWLEVYYDCQLTRLGITLVDTPGADSINARHTNLSFNYIRQSDVVLFVTYYNHAFSRADREFLIQLGRVKDSFALDKMFFIVNAIDLAENQQEAQGVIDYVADQLRKFGVGQPRMFGLSSQEILKSKAAGQTQGFAFEDAFYNFVFHELTDIAVNAAAGEYKLAQERLQELIALSQGNAEEKQQRRLELEEQQKKADGILAGLDNGEMEKRQQQELQELIYYVNQRVFIRYMDFYRESFNPATLQKKGNNSKMLAKALGELLNSMGFDFAQELRATSLRLEKFLQKQGVKLQQQINDKLREISGELPLSLQDVSYSCDLEFVTAFQQAEGKYFQSALAIYKNPKAFFEGGGSREMADALEKLLHPLADKYLAQQQEMLAQEMSRGVEKVFDQVKERFQNRLAENFVASKAALKGDVPVEILLDIQKQLV